MKRATINNVTFEVPKKGTKFYENLLQRASCYDGHYLSDVYGRHSYDKERVENYWIEFMRECNGEAYSITSHNSFSFTLSFCIETPVRGVCYITPSHNYFLED